MAQKIVQYPSEPASYDKSLSAISTSILGYAGSFFTSLTSNSRYLGEINDNQQAAWCKTIEVLQEGQAQPQAVAIFPEDRIAPALGGEIVSIKPSRTAATPSSAMGRLLAGLSTVGSVAAG